jgi:hypothetical protein
MLGCLLVLPIHRLARVPGTILLFLASLVDRYESLMTRCLAIKNSPEFLCRLAEEAVIAI